MDLPCVIVRGGTSKGVYLSETDLPSDEAARTKVICALFGSADIRQIDGLGGGDPLTSKVAILSRHGDEVGYLSGEVRLGEKSINYGIMCGNLVAGVGQAAHHLHLISAVKDHCVNIFNVNNKTHIVAKYSDFASATRGNESGVSLCFASPAGAITGNLLPTGEPVTVLNVGLREIQCSIVEGGAIYAFLLAKSFGLTAEEPPTELDAMMDFKKEVELVRKAVTETINSRLLNKNININSGQVKVAIVGKPSNDSSRGELVGRIINPAATHKAYAVSGAISTCAAAAIDGTLVNQIAKKSLNNSSLRIIHPDGMLDVDVEFLPHGLSISEARIYRTSRLLMKGIAFVDEASL